MPDPVLLPVPGLARPPAPDPGAAPVRLSLTWGRRYDLHLFTFGLACCAVEVVAASLGGADGLRLGAAPAATGPREAQLLVVSGTVTDKVAPAVVRAYEQMSGPRYVLSFGSCAHCGGPYWDSYSVTKGIDQLLPVDVYVPGCPPRPEALLHGLRLLQQQIDGTPAPADRVPGASTVRPPGPGPVGPADLRGLLP